MRRRKTVAAGFGLVAALVSVTSVAWACTAQLGMKMPARANPGSAVTVEGDAASSSVELRWDGVDGPLLGVADAAKNARFAVGIRVPETENGIHTVVAVSRNADGTVASRSQLALEVGPPVAAVARSGRLYGETSGGARDSRMAAGVGLLGFGSVALFGGFAVVEVRRRKALAL